jgi:hypothetical protein
MIKAVRAIVHKGVTAQEAFELYQKSRKTAASDNIDESLEKV